MSDTDVSIPKIGYLVKQPGGYKAFVPNKFPPKEPLLFGSQTHRLHEKAALLLGKLDGITQLVPDLDFFIFMYVRKEAALSSQIEGTRATIVDAMHAEIEPSLNLPDDVNDILHYKNAMNLGLKRLSSLPLSLRLLREVHKELMEGARSSHFSAPGEFRTTQNWIGGSKPETAAFVPPPVHEMKQALNDFEKFLHSDSDIEVLIRAALAHAQFETIHPFLDGNGRTGRLLITFYLCQQEILERPVLYLSEYFKKHRDVYFDLLHNYHSRGAISPWVNFFLQGIIEVAGEAIEISRQITVLRENDSTKIQLLGRSAENGMKVLRELFKLPITNVQKIQQWTSLSRANANTLTNKLVKIGILKQQNKETQYARIFHYQKYMSLFL